MNFNQKNIGIWGFGIVGKSVAKFLNKHGANITILDNRLLSQQESLLVYSINASYVLQNSDTLDTFFRDNEYVIVSAGIDIRNFTQYHAQFITELDLFAAFFKKPIIAITGSIGKTTVTTLIKSFLEQSGLRIALGGNIGIALCDVLDNQDEIDYAVIEVSSFQLEHCKYFAPDYALWTNLFPNHLDRHGSLGAYAKAKWLLLAHQNSTQHALVHLDVLKRIEYALFKGIMNCFIEKQPTSEQLKTLDERIGLFFIKDDNIFYYFQRSTVMVASCKMIPLVSFAANRLICVALLYLLKIPLPLFLSGTASIALPEHRLEKFATINHIDFYNDSKATIMEATMAAVQTLQGKPLILIVGGTSKQVDRTFFFPQLTPFVSFIVCFGAEASVLCNAAQEAQIAASAYATLEEAFQKALQKAFSGAQILFSPGGASFDLFKNYQERGKRFKELVFQLQNQ